MKKNILIAILSIFIIGALVDTNPGPKKPQIYMYNGPWEELPDSTPLIQDVVCDDTIYLTVKPYDYEKI